MKTECRTFLYIHVLLHIHCNLLSPQVLYFQHPFISSVIKKKVGIWCIYSWHKISNSTWHIQSKGTALLLLFFILKSQWGLPHGANTRNISIHFMVFIHYITRDILEHLHHNMVSACGILLTGHSIVCYRKHL